MPWVPLLSRKRHWPRKALANQLQIYNRQLQIYNQYVYQLWSAQQIAMYYASNALLWQQQYCELAQLIQPVEGIQPVQENDSNCLESEFIVLDNNEI